MSRTIEYRTTRSPVLLRERDHRQPPGNGPILAGYAATFNSPSSDLGGFVEVLAPGCFTETLKTADVRAFWNHCYEHLLGRTKSGTLRLTEDETGLAFEIDVPETSLGRDTYELVKRGDIDGVSFGFFAVRDEWSPDGKVNTVLEAELIEISPVSFPAYENGPKVEARSIERLAKRPKPRFPKLERARAIIRLDDEI